MKNIISTTVIVIALCGKTLFAQQEIIAQKATLPTPLLLCKLEYKANALPKKTNKIYLQKQGRIINLNDNEVIVKRKSVGQTIPIANGTIEVKAFPNPVVSDLTIIITDALVSKSVYEIQLFDLLGKKVFSQIFSVNQNIINLDGITAGTYVLYVQKNRSPVLQEKLIKQ